MRSLVISLFGYFHIATNCGKHTPGQDMTKVSGHFIRGNDQEKFASTLVNFMGKVYFSLFHLFIDFYVDQVWEFSNVHHLVGLVLNMHAFLSCVIVTSQLLSFVFILM